MVKTKMPSTKDKKSKSKLLKIDISSDSGSDESEHELSYHAKDKVKLMKEVLKLIKPKKIKSMAPDCIKNLDIVDINSMLLEELLGISNKRLQYIFNGENVDRETSSSESEEEKQPIDVISLDDISDDDIEPCASQNEKCSSDTGLGKHNNLKLSKIKTEVVDKIKSEKLEKSRKEIKKKSKNIKEVKNKDPDLKEADKDKLMSVLELLELQARARAIRSQLAIETEKKKEPDATQKMIIKKEESDSDAVIIESPQHKEIIITSSDSDEEKSNKILQTAETQDSSTSGILQHCTLQANSELGILPPQKKQKHIANKNAENKKEKLLAKIQKIKLVRHKTISRNDLSTNIETNNVETNEHIDQPCNTQILIDDPTTTSQMCSNTNEVNQESGLQNITQNETISENNEDCKVDDNVIDVESEDTFSELIKGSPKDIPRKVANYCDNDEIVINLDEDEMDGIEND